MAYDGSTTTPRRWRLGPHGIEQRSVLQELSWEDWNYGDTIATNRLYHRDNHPVPQSESRTRDVVHSSGNSAVQWRPVPRRSAEVFRQTPAQAVALPRMPSTIRVSNGPKTPPFAAQRTLAPRAPLRSDSYVTEGV